MGRRSLQAIRRKELIEATISTISLHGIAETTISRIGTVAGVSPGIIHHYFTGKDELLEAVMRSLLFNLQGAVLSELKKLDDPYERISAIVDGNLSPDQFTRDVVRTWLAFWDHSPQSTAIARLQRVNALRTRSNLLHALKKILPADTASTVAANLTALMDGLWLRCALDKDDLSPKEARRLAMSYVDIFVKVHS